MADSTSGRAFNVSCTQDRNLKTTKHSEEYLQRMQSDAGASAEGAIGIEFAFVMQVEQNESCSSICYHVHVA